jgi:hypothetical protein
MSVITQRTDPVRVTSAEDHYDQNSGDHVQTSQAREKVSMASLTPDNEPTQAGSKGKGISKKNQKTDEKFVRLSVNLSFETAETFKELLTRKGMSITEGIRRAIAVWKFLEDERSRGNEIAVIEKDDTVRKVVFL